MNKVITRAAAFFMATAFAGTLWPSTGLAVDKCKVKVKAADGTILVNAKDVSGTLLWGYASGAETNAFSNAGTCVTGGVAKRCELAASPDPARITPPELCTLYLKDGAGTCSTFIKPCTPGVRNAQGFVGDGFVKAWARINSDGTVASCYKCNPAGTTHAGTGNYVVDFAPLTSNIAGRPRSATLDTLSTGTIAGFIGVADSIALSSGVWVSTEDTTGADADLSFSLIIY